MPKIGQAPQLGVLAAVLSLGIVSLHRWLRRRDEEGDVESTSGPGRPAEDGVEVEQALGKADVSQRDNRKENVSEAPVLEVIADSSRAKEVSTIAEESLASAIAYFDDVGSSWKVTGEEDGVQLSNLTVPSCRLPIFRGLLDIPADTAPDLVDVAQVMLSSYCRRFWDPFYDRGMLLQQCGSCTGLVCNFRKATPVEGPSYGVSAYATGRSSGSNYGRITVAAAGVPQHIVESYSTQIKKFCEDKEHAAHQHLLAVDALRREDGSLRVGYILHTDAGAVRIPTFLLRKLLASAPALPILQIVTMSTQGITPRDTIALTGPEPEETEERVLGGRHVHISKVLLDIFPDESHLIGGA